MFSAEDGYLRLLARHIRRPVCKITTGFEVDHFVSCGVETTKFRRKKIANNEISNNERVRDTFGDAMFEKSEFRNPNPRMKSE